MARGLALFLLAISTLASLPLSHAFDQDDYEIFDLNDAVQVLLPGSSFYSILNTTEDATPVELTKAYRKTSLQYHPDKSPSAEMSELYTHMTSIINVLKSLEKRERYDHFLRNGFPIWRGTGYFYRRFRPGVGFVSVFVLLFISFTQYLSGWVSYLRHGMEFKELQARIDEVQYKQFKGQAKKLGFDAVNKEEFEMYKDEYVAVMLDIDLEHIKTLGTKPRFVNTFIFRLPGILFRFVVNLPAKIRDARALVKERAVEALRKKELDNEEDVRQAELALNEGLGGGGGASRKARRRKMVRQGSNSSMVSSVASSVSGSGEPSRSTSSSSIHELAMGNDSDAYFGVDSNTKTKPDSKTETPAEPQIKTDAWTPEEYSRLSKLMIKIPAGRANRWSMIAKELNRSVDNCTTTSKQIQADPRKFLVPS